LVGCDDPKFDPPQETIDKAKAGDYKHLSIDQAKHSKTQSKEIKACNENIEDLKKYQDRVTKGKLD